MDTDTRRKLDFTGGSVVAIGLLLVSYILRLICMYVCMNECMVWWAS